MPRGRPKSDSATKQTEKRLTIRFSTTDQRHLMVFDYLKELPYGQKTDAIVNAICFRANEYHALLKENQRNVDDIQKIVQSEIKKAIPQIAQAILAEMKQSGLAFSPPPDNEMAEPNPNLDDSTEDSADMESAMAALKLAELFS